MLNFISLSLQNFLSYGANSTIIDLQRKGTTLILGKDLDSIADGTGANGTGKSSIIQALIFAVYGKTLSNISLNNLVNNTNKKNMEVTVTFEKDGKYYHIKRVRKGKDGNYMKFFVKKGSIEFTDDDEITRDNVNHTNEEIEKVIGMPFELFCRIVVFSATHMPFLNLPLPQQSKFIEELFSLTILSEKADVLKDIIKDSERSMEISLNKKNLLTEEHERHQQQLDSAKERVKSWNIQYKNKIKELNENIKKSSTVNVETEIKKHKELEQIQHHLNETKKTYDQEMTHLNDTKNQYEEWENNNENKIFTIKNKLKKIEGVDVEEQQELHSQLDNIEKEIKIVESEINQIGNVKNELNIKLDKKQNELKHLQSDKCPYCLQEYTDSKKKQKEVHIEIENLSFQLSEISETSQEISDELKDLHFKHKQVKGKITIGNVEELLDIKSELFQLEQSLIELSTITNPFIKLLESIDESKLKEMKIELKRLNKKENEIFSKITQDHDELINIQYNLKLYKDQLKEAKKEKNPFHEPLKELEDINLEEINNEEIDKLDKLIRHQKFLRNLLTKKDSFIRKTLLDNNVSFLNTKLQEYLNELGLPHYVKFTHNLTANISMFGKELDFGNLSHGQQARVNIALSLSFRDLLESLHTPINVFLLDEILDEGLDTVGVESAAKLIKRKTRDEGLSTFIISHKTEIDRRFEHIMTVRMENEFSYIQEE